MKTTKYQGKWNISSMLPKRDLNCLDKEDWPMNELNNLPVRYEKPIAATPPMVVGWKYLPNGLIMDQYGIIYDLMAIGSGKKSKLEQMV